MRRVLLLNVTYEPLTTVGLRRAVCLVLGDKAEIVHHDTGGQLLHAATVAVATPSVIRLRRYVRIPQRNRVPLTRAALMRRDNYKCAYCGRHAETIDHVLPRSRGGQHAWENCVAACQMCNHRKADRLLVRARLDPPRRARPSPGARTGGSSAPSTTATRSGRPTSARPAPPDVPRRLFTSPCRLRNQPALLVRVNTQTRRRLTVEATYDL